MAGTLHQHMKLNQKRQYAKLFGISGEIFEESLVPFLSKILQSCFKKLDDAQLHISISDSVGVLTHHALKNLPLEQKLSNLTSMLNLIFSEFSNHSKPIQVGTAMILTRLIQNSPVDALTSLLESITTKLLALTNSSSTKCTTQILETLISLILAVEVDFEPYTLTFLPVLLKCMKDQDWTCRKMAVDVVYTISSFLSDNIVNYEEEILRSLSECKVDKIKPVREAALEAIAKVKEKRQNREGEEEYQEHPVREQENEITRQSTDSAVRSSVSFGANKVRESRSGELGKERIRAEREGKRKGAVERKKWVKTSPVKPKERDESSSIFKGPLNPNFFKAAPKNTIEIWTNHPVSPENKVQKDEDLKIEFDKEKQKEQEREIFLQEIKEKEKLGKTSEEKIGLQGNISFNRNYII
jgi:hypothetical protein